MKQINVGINGFGRIGRIASRIILQRKNLKLAAINSRADSMSHQYLLKHDSVYGTLADDVKSDEKNLYVNGQKVNVYNCDNPGEIPWDRSFVDVVIDSTGKFRTTGDLEGHLGKNVKNVILSAPAKDNTKTIVLGVNQKTFDPKKDKIISNSSCTTNCLSTVIKVLHENLTVSNGFMTTIHAVTDSQNLLDNSHKKEARLRRSAFLSMIPSSTGSAKDIGKLYPDLNGKIICQAIRIPTPTVSMIDLAVEVKKNTDAGEVNKLFKKYSETRLKGILSITNEELVSKDFTGNPHSAIVDTYLTKVLNGTFIKIYAWYDNEWGYASRLIDLVEYSQGKLKI